MEQIFPKSRFQQYVNKEDGSNVVRCFTHSCPQYYKDINGILKPIDLTIKDSVSTIGDIELRDKGILGILGVR